MNKRIEEIFSDFEIDGVQIPVEYLYYEGKANKYVVYMEESTSASLAGDDDLIGYADFYDFDVYGKGNIKKIIKEVKTRMKEGGFIWIPERTSSDMYEVETGFYHKTLSFGIHRSVYEEE